MENITTASIVLFKTPDFQIKRILDCLTKSKIFHTIFIVDNSPKISKFSFNSYMNVDYIKNNNTGYGAGHNIAIRRALPFSKFHLIINPDIYFNESIFEKIITKMSQESDIGLLMPKVLYPNGSIQYLCKLIPTPLDLFIRRFLPPFLDMHIFKRNFKYELRFTKYDTEMNVPTLSGCFLFTNINVFKSVGMFDERFFMYLEDVDLTRRVHANFKTLFYPEVEVFHEYGKSSYRSTKMLCYHVISALQYFNKWGWFKDAERDRLNIQFLKSFKIQG